MINLKLKAKAIVAVRKRKKLEEEARLALEARERAIESRLLDALSLHIPSDGKDGLSGADAPSMQEILAELTPLLPQPTHTETTVVQEVNPTDMEVFIKGLLPEIQPEDRPAVEQITIDVSEEKLEGFVSQEEFKKALRRIQDAISANASGGSATVNNHDLPWHVIAEEIVADREQAAIHGELFLDGNLILEGSAQLVIEN